MESVWPPSATVVARRHPGRLTVYRINGTPLFYMADSDLLQPTLYLLHAAPQVLPAVTVFQGVGRKVCGGADLFMPGVRVAEAAPGKSWVLENFGRFEKGAARALVDEGHWVIPTLSIAPLRCSKCLLLCASLHHS